MITKETLSSLKTAKAQYDYARRNNVGVTAKRQALCNILLTHCDDLIETAMDAQYLLKTTTENNKLIGQLRKEIAVLNSKEVESDTPENTNSSDEKSE